LADYFRREFSRLYDRNHNPIFVMSDQKHLFMQVSNKMNLLERNFEAFYTRKIELQPGVKIDEVNVDNKIRVKSIDEQSEDSSEEMKISLRKSSSASSDPSPVMLPRPNLTFTGQLKVHIQENKDKRKKLLVNSFM
jgi:hypothetical protein